MATLSVLRRFLALLITFAATPLAAADFVVTTTADSGAGSLRQALIDANADGVPSAITFAPALSGQTIAPLSALPILNEAGTTIDGDSNNDCVPDVAIDGQNAPGSDGLWVQGNSETIEGLSIRRFQNGISLSGNGSTVRCNYIGTNFAQQPGFGNLMNGVFVFGSDHVIGPGNVITHNAQAGVRVQDGAVPAYPEFTALTPDYTGVFTQIAFESPNETFQTVGGGIVPLDGGGRPFTDNFGLRLRGELNISSAGSYSFTLNPLDDSARITVDSVVIADGNGPGPLSGNISLSAGAHTIRIDFMEYGGFAGTTLAINGPGSASLSTNSQAVCATGQPGLCGELFQLRVATERNRISQNRIADNGDLGIKLRCCGGPLPNDSGDTDLGGNTWLNRPTLTSMVSAGNGMYTLSGTAPANATVEVFIAVVDPTNSGEGGSLFTTTAANGSGNFSTTLALPAQPSLLTATATDALGNTSEFGPNLSYGAAADTVALGSGVSVVAGASANIPIYVRDLAFTSLGLDRASGERIQGLALRVNFPAGTLTAGSIAPAGITTSLTPLFGPNSTFNANSVNYLVSYNESSNLVPFTLDAAAPGDLVAMLTVTVAGDHPTGTLPLTFDVVTEVSNQAGTIAENSGNGTLTRVGANLAVTSSAPTGLYARAQSTSSVQLSWFDPNLSETGIRVERSSDGTNFTTVQDLGPNDTSFLDGGRTPGTLYYYRVRTLFGAQAGGASNRATATTYPATAANICVDSQAISRRWARSPDAAFRGPEWGLVYHDRDDGTHEQVYFQRLDGTTLAPLGARVQVSNTQSTAAFPAIGFNGTHYAVTWLENLRGAPGSFPSSEWSFAQLDANGTVLRQPRRIIVPQPALVQQSFNEIVRPIWDGTHWATFVPQQAANFDYSIAYRRLEPDGDVVLGPTVIDSATNAFLFSAAAAWQAASSEFGVVWLHSKDTTTQLRFQRVEESNGLTQLPSPVVIDTIADGSGMGGTDIVAAPGGGWLAAWSACNDSSGECLVYTRRIAANGTPDPGGRVQVSAPGSLDIRFRIVTRPGGYAVFTERFSPIEEIARYHLDANGIPDGGGVTVVSALDGRRSGRPRVASDGSRALVLWSESLATMEIAGLLSDGVSGTLGAEVALSSGHDPANTAAVVVPGQPRIVPLGGGFASVWQELDSGTNLIHGRLYGANGQLVTDFNPLSVSTNASRPGLAAVGSTFALAWRTNGNLRFARYAADGTVLVAETQLLSSVGNGTVELEWDGENYVAVFNQGTNMRYVRISEAGVAAATITLALALPAAPNLWRLAWMGDGWALVLRRNDDSNLYYARFASDGTVLLPPTPITATTPPSFTANDISLAYDGTTLSVTWAETRGLDPPGQDIYFTTLNRNGTKGFPEVALVASPAFDSPAQLHHANGRFHLVYPSDNEGLAGMRELEIDLVPGGAVDASSRHLANRGSGAVATTHDGATLAMAWRAATVQDIHIETDACLADPTPPPCPTVSVQSLANNVRLAWSAVSDAQSGIHRHHVYRDGRIIAELPAAATQFDDSGYNTTVIHNYSVRAMNRAFQESVACPAVGFSTRVGDANGNGVLDVADIFYLINFLLGDGASPIGDGDANGDGLVSATDIFFLINFFFGGGPIPTLAAVADIAADKQMSVLREPRAATQIKLGRVTASAGDSVSVPVSVRDGFGSPLGMEKALGADMQSLAFRIRVLPSDAIVAVRVERAGVMAQAVPRFEIAPRTADGVAYLAVFDTNTGPLVLPTRKTTTIAVLHLTLAPELAPGTRIELRLDPAAAVLANAAGTADESVANGWIELHDGLITVR